MKKWIYLSSLLLISNYCFASDNGHANNSSDITENFSSKDSQQNYQSKKDFSGHRIGIGIVDAQYVSENVVKFEYGYEFNGIAGFNLSGSSHDENITDTVLKYDGTYTQVSTDLGYTFALKGFDLKPYALLGLMNISESVSLDNNSSVVFQGGLGLRATLDFGIYLDLSIKNANLDDFSILTDRDGLESALTMGYKY